MEPTEGFAKQSEGSGGRRPLIAAIAAVVLAASIYLVFFHAPAPSPRPAVPQLPFGPEEQAYAGKLQFGNLAMSRAENFLHQEVTIMSGEVANTGGRPVQAIDATITFQDDMQQIVLRETRSLLRPGAAPLEPGKTVSFEISFDHVPPSWNVQTPSVRVVGVQLAGNKR